MRVHILLIPCLMLSCSQKPVPSSTSNSVVTIYRVTPEGDKEMEVVKELDEHGNAVKMYDYMGGEIYQVHWSEYADGRLIKDISAPCETCEQTTTYFEYEGEQLIKRWDHEKEASFEYDGEGNRIQELEIFTESKFLRRFKLMEYENGLMNKKRSFDLSDLSIPSQGLDLDSLLTTGVTPYHMIENKYDDSGVLVESHYSGAVSDWFQVHKHFYDEQGRPIRVEYSSEAGESGGSRIYEYGEGE
jgi:hypothetical protein